MIQTGQSGGDCYANSDTIAVANTAQLCAQGAEATTFAVTDEFTDKATGVRWIEIVHASTACYVAKDSTKIAATEGGALNDRIYIAAGTTGLVLPWSGLDVYFVNAVAGETPLLSVIGWY